MFKKIVAIIFGLQFLTFPAGATTTTYKICGLPDAGTVADTDHFELSRACMGSYNATAAELATYFLGKAPGTDGQLVFNSGGKFAAAPASTLRAKLGLAPVAASGAYSDLTGTPTIPTSTSQLTNGAGYLTAITGSQVTGALGYTPQNAATAFSGAFSALTGKPSTVSGYGITDTTAQPLTGFTSASGAVTSADSILTAIEKLSGTPGGVSSIFGRTGAVTSQTGDYSVSQVTGAAPLNGGSLTATAVNGVTLSSAGSASSYLNATGGYSTPSGAGGGSTVAGLTLTAADTVGATAPSSYAIPPSTSQITANTTAINNAIAVGRAVVSCTAASPIIYVNAPIVLRSNSRLTVDPTCIIRQASGTTNTMLTNYAQTQPWTTLWDSSGSIANGPLNMFQAPAAWAASTAYSQGSTISTNAGVYWQSASSCTSSSSGMGPGGTGTGIVEGTCSWNYVTAITPQVQSSPYTQFTRSQYYAILHMAAHGLHVGDFLWVTPQPNSVPDVNGNNRLWSGLASAGQLGGPADTAYFGVFFVAAINDANYVTLELRRQPNAQFTGIPVQAKLADQNIKIDDGGTFDYNFVQNNTGGLLYQNYDVSFIWGVHNLILNNLNSVNSYKYAWNIGAVSNAEVGHTQGGSYWLQNSSVNGDQVHIYGPAFDVYVHDVNGLGYDDTVVLSTSENTTLGNSMQIAGVGDIYNAYIRNVGGVGGERVGLFQSQSAGLLRIENVVIDKVEPYSARPPYPSILLGGCGAFNGITIENSTIKDLGQYLVNVAANSGCALTADKLILKNNNITTSSAGLLNLSNGNASATTSIQMVTLEDNTIMNATSAAVTATVIGTANNVSVGHLVFQNNLVQNNAPATNVIDIPQYGSFPRIVVENNRMQLSNQQSIVNDASGSTMDVTFAHNNVSGGGGGVNHAFMLKANTTAALTGRFIGNGVGGSSYPLDVPIAGATVSVYGDGTNLAPSGWFQFDTTIPTLKVYGYDIQCDVTKLARATGEYCTNTNAAPGSGTLTTAGPIMDQGTSTGSWFAMFNPTGQTY